MSESMNKARSNPMVRTFFAQSRAPVSSPIWGLFEAPLHFFHQHLWWRWVKPSCADLLFNHQIYSELQRTCSRVGPGQAQLASKRNALVQACLWIKTRGVTISIVSRISIEMTPQSWLLKSKVESRIEPCHRVPKRGKTYTAVTSSNLKLQPMKRYHGNCQYRRHSNWTWTPSCFSEITGVEIFWDPSELYQQHLLCRQESQFVSYAMCV